jgi:hypothetical protein
MKSPKDYYKILGVNPNATLSEIREAYRRLATQNHPDRNPTSQATARMQEINEAYKVVGNINNRRKYDFERPNSTATTQTNSSSSTKSSIIINKSQQSFTQGEKAPTIISYSLSTAAFLVFFFSFLIVSGLLLLVLARGSNNYAGVTPDPSSSSSSNLTHATGKTSVSNTKKAQESNNSNVPTLLLKATPMQIPPTKNKIVDAYLIAIEHKNWQVAYNYLCQNIKRQIRTPSDMSLLIFEELGYNTLPTSHEFLATPDDPSRIWFSLSGLNWGGGPYEARLEGSQVCGVGLANGDLRHLLLPGAAPLDIPP